MDFFTSSASCVTVMRTRLSSSFSTLLFNESSMGLGENRARPPLRAGAAGAPWVVRARGLEPPRVSPPGPKPGASASSATPAREARLYNKLGRRSWWERQPRVGSSGGPYRDRTYDLGIK